MKDSGLDSQTKSIKRSFFKKQNQNCPTLTRHCIPIPFYYFFGKKKILQLPDKLSLTMFNLRYCSYFYYLIIKLSSQWAHMPVHDFYNSVDVRNIVVKSKKHFWIRSGLINKEKDFQLSNILKENYAATVNALFDIPGSTYV